MKKKNCRDLCVSISMLAAFVLWTLAACSVDVKSIGPNGSAVGFSALNGFVHKLTGVNMALYHITDWLGLVPIFVALGFASLGIAQWIKRKKLSRVDFSLFVLGCFYTLTVAVYILFEIIAINYRPILIDGILEASYPSSTTLLTMCVMPTALMQFNKRIKKKPLRLTVATMITLFTVVVVGARLISGVHWLTDIIGGALLSAGLVMLYRGAVECRSIDRRK